MTTPVKRFQHLAFMKHCKAVLRPFRVIGKPLSYRIEGISISLYYSHQVGAVVSLWKSIWEKNAKSEAKTITRPEHLHERLELWKTAIRAENLTFREQTLIAALLNFTPPETPPPVRLP